MRGARAALVHLSALHSVPAGEPASRVGDLGDALKHEMHYASLYRAHAAEVHALLAVRDGRSVGLLLLGRCNELFAGRWHAPGDLRRHERERFCGPLITTHAVRWTVGFVGVWRGCRRSGLATALVRVAQDCLRLPLRRLAWCPPFSEAGEAFVRRLCGDRFLVGQ